MIRDLKGNLPTVLKDESVRNVRSGESMLSRSAFRKLRPSEGEELKWEHGKSVRKPNEQLAV